MTTFLKLSPDSQLEEDKLHLVPADIQYDGQANVHSYFDTTFRQTEDSSMFIREMTASLRGRPLQGAKFEVPSGYTGIFLTETRKPVVEGDDRELTGNQTFKGFTYWNLDRSPGDGDAIKQAMNWIEIAKILHSPLSTEECSQSSLKSEVSI